MYQLSERGSIHCLALDFPPIGQLRRERECCEWSEDVQSLEETANVSSDMGPMHHKLPAGSTFTLHIKVRAISLHHVFGIQLYHSEIFNANPDDQTVSDEHSKSRRTLSIEWPLFAGFRLTRMHADNVISCL